MPAALTLRDRNKSRCAAPGAVCPFHDGPATLDALLAELGPRGGTALDLALDLRFAFQQQQDAADCVALALRLRRALGANHYLAFYRVRAWLARALAIEVRADHGEAWTRISLPLQASACEPLEYACVQRWVQDRPGRRAVGAQVRYVFTSLASGAQLAAAAHQ